MRNKPKQVLPQTLMIIAILAILLLSGCKGIVVHVIPTKPKLSDVIDIEIRVGDMEDATNVTYQVNEISGTISSSPYTFQYNTCKSTGTYHESLSIFAEVTYNDASVRDYSKTYDLTESHWSRDDNGSDIQDYSVYVARDDSHGQELIMFGMAGYFMDEFDSKSKLHYYWAENGMFTWSSISWVDAVDLILYFGHGNPLYIAATRGDFAVDLSKQAYGSCARCGTTGDLEYMAFCSCYTLNMEPVNNESFTHYWKHISGHELENRPFSGIHAVMGFQYDFAVVSLGVPGYALHNGDDFTKEFADNLDDGKTVRRAWLDANDDELYFTNNDNMGAVLYLLPYQDEIITDSNNDYIWDHLDYTFIAVEYFTN